MLIDLSGPYPRVWRSHDRLTFTIHWLCTAKQPGTATQFNLNAPDVRLPVTVTHGPDKRTRLPCAVTISPGLDDVMVECHGIFLTKSKGPLNICVTPDLNINLFLGITPILTVSPDKPPPGAMDNPKVRQTRVVVPKPPTLWNRILRDKD